MKFTIVKAVSFIALLYILLYSFFIYISILEYKDMDFNQNGWIELSETFTAIDIGENHLNNNFAVLICCIKQQLELLFELQVKS